MWYLHDLNLNIDLNKTLRERIDLDKTWVDCAVEATKLGDKTNITLVNRLVRVGANNATRNSTAETDEGTEIADYFILLVTVYEHACA